MPITTLSKRSRNTTTTVRSRDSCTEQSDPEGRLSNVSHLHGLHTTRQEKQLADNSKVMQLSLKTGQATGQPPSYPVADTIALLLILINFPNLLLTATQLLFSYKEHFALSPSINPSGGPTIYMIVFMDIVVVLFTAIVLPSLRNTITDISQVIVAISISGTKWRSLLPYAAIFLSIRGLWHRLRMQPLSQFPGEETSFRSQNFASHYIVSLCKNINNTFRPIAELRADGKGVQHIKSALAVHIVALGCVRLVRYWLRQSSPVDSDNIAEQTEQLDSLASSVKARRTRISPSVAAKYPCNSLWDFLLQLRADVVGKRHEFTQCSNQFVTKDVWISEISARAVVFGVCTASTGEPTVLVRVNGLLWETKIVRNIDATLATHTQSAVYWRVTVDNLSAKTEYDFSLTIEAPGQPLQYTSAICTMAHVAFTKQSRAEVQLLPSLNTNVSEDPMHYGDGSTPVSGPLSPITTLEDSITNASSKLEERKSLIRRIRKENSKKVQQLHREVEYLAAKVYGVADKNEQRIQGRMLSLQTEIKRTQDQIDEMEEEKGRTSIKIVEQGLVWSQEKNRRDREAQVLERVRQKYESEKFEHQKRLGSVASDANRIRAKADKLSLKRTKIQQELDRLSFEQDQVLKQETYARNSARESIRNQRLQTESEYLKIIHELQQRIEFLDVYGST